MASTRATVAFLHTSPVHVATFDHLMAARLPACRLTHLVDESLLADARRGGLDSRLAARVQARLDELAADSPVLIVCTCSSIGPLVEAASRPCPALRVDRPMADAAVAIASASGGTIGVAAALASTVEPTRALLSEAAAAAGTVLPPIESIPCNEAWPAFERGDLDAYATAIARTVRPIAGRHAVIVLAQASMAVAQPLLRDLAVPVLDSPTLALDAIARRLGEP